MINETSLIRNERDMDFAVAAEVLHWQYTAEEDSGELHAPYWTDDQGNVWDAPPLFHSDIGWAFTIFTVFPGSYEVQGDGNSWWCSINTEDKHGYGVRFHASHNEVPMVICLAAMQAELFHRNRWEPSMAVAGYSRLMNALSWRGNDAT